MILKVTSNVIIKKYIFFLIIIFRINCDKFSNNCNMYPIVMNIMPHDSRGKFNFYIIDCNAHRMIATACLFAQHILPHRCMSAEIVLLFALFFFFHFFLILLFNLNIVKVK